MRRSEDQVAVSNLQYSKRMRPGRRHGAGAKRAGFRYDAWEFLGHRGL